MHTMYGKTMLKPIELEPYTIIQYSKSSFETQ